MDNVRLCAQRKWVSGKAAFPKQSDTLPAGFVLKDNPDVLTDTVLFDDLSFLVVRYLHANVL